MDAKQKEATNAALKWQNELAEANAKINQLIKKGKSLNEELTQNRKESHEVQQSKYSDNQKVERVMRMSYQKVEFISEASRANTFACTVKSQELSETFVLHKHSSLFCKIF